MANRKNPVQTLNIKPVKGMRTDLNPMDLPPDSLMYLNNCYISTEGIIKQRPGVVKIIDTSDYSFVWCDVLPVATGEPYFIRTSTQTIVSKYSDGVLTDVVTYSGNILLHWAYYAIYGNYTYIVTPLNAYKFDVIAETLTEVTSFPNGNIIEIYKDRAFIGNVKFEENLLMFSAIGDVENFTTTTNFIALDGYLTAMKVIGDFLFVGTTTGLYKISSTGNSLIPFNLEIIAKVGVLGKSINEIKPGVACVVTRDSRVIVFDVYSKSGSPLDDSIGKPISSLIKMEYEIDGDLIVKPGLFKSADGNSLFVNVFYKVDHAPKHHVLRFGVDTGAWSIYEDMDIRHMLSYGGVDYFSFENYKYNKIGYGYFDKTATQDYYGVIPVDITTPVYAAHPQEVFKNFRELYVTTTASTEMTADVYVAVNTAYSFNSILDSLDSIDPTAPWLGQTIIGNFIVGGANGVTCKLRVDKTANGIQFKIKKTSDNDFQIDSMRLQYIVGYKQ